MAISAAADQNGVPVGVLALSHDIVRNEEGDNDGVVSVDSARFGQRRENWTFLETWPEMTFLKGDPRC